MPSPPTVVSLPKRPRVRCHINAPNRLGFTPRAVVLLRHMLPSSFPIPPNTPNQAHGGASARDAVRPELTTFDKQPSGRLSVPYVLLYYLPITCNSELRMLYAGAKELMRSTSEAGRVIDLESIDDLDEIPKKLSVE